MKVNKAIETEEGIVKFEGELTQEEFDLVLGVGLNWLMKEGALPLINDTTAPPTDQLQ